MALNVPAVTTEDPGRGGVRGTRPERSPWGSLGGHPLNSLLLPFLLTRKGRPLGVRGHGPNGPRRRDLRGPIDHIPVKPSASNIPVPPGQGAPSHDLEHVEFEIVCLRNIPQNGMIRRLLARFYLPERYACIKRRASKHILKQLLCHKM